ncbi:MAG: acyl-CoA thioesterase [Euryarchaeota archaeon]|nr:acyl-CoA thioesterase [Euryarchaeota archaeon]
MFKKTQKVYFGHIDRAGIVYHPHFIDYFHQAYEDFLESLGFAEQTMSEELGARFPVVNVNVDYHRPVQPNSRLAIELHVKRIGRTSITYGFRALEAQGQAVAEGDIVRVAIDKDFRPVPVPKRLRNALARHLENA